MQSTKQQILTLLKRTGSVTVEEAAGALSVASMTARQHLVGLEKDGLVRSAKVKRGNGRPHYLFELTPKGDEMFPRRYDILAGLILDEVSALEPADIAGLGPGEKRSLLIQRTADRLAERHQPQFEGRRLASRVAAVAQVLHVIGGFAEWFENEEGFEIRDYNCIFARILGEGAEGCEWHVRLLTRLLGLPVRHEVMSHGGLHCCRYWIAART